MACGAKAFSKRSGDIEHMMILYHKPPHPLALSVSSLTNLLSILRIERERA
jgi:hypothetical protein